MNREIFVIPEFCETKYPVSQTYAEQNGMPDLVRHDSMDQIAKQEKA